MSPPSISSRAINQSHLMQHATSLPERRRHSIELFPAWIFDAVPENDVIASISRSVSLTNASRLLMRSMRWFVSLIFGRPTANSRMASVEQRARGWEPVKQKFKEHRFGQLPLLKLFSHRTIPSRTQWRRIISRGKRICGPPAKGASSKGKGSTFKNGRELDGYWISTNKLGVL